ncbi:3-methyl-2-oxobutanoate hydroxymethyltransferase [Aeromicrobium sp. CnD17-E]|uniref:3-methyl-2-oxobutanoate hydroxymethyltransferase n=1 Tax=Aeromicrobium sp. CnD17-E TaxID=2954487 RepID=UPI002097D0C4|nr:3-methyl-2-oxobutanoate hydroxymethyltransferase [Aeromicrobium sp. CnD17-E]MCO7238590.1 3-methyl-2-oxobutanoate hydroxymethyltransferase [Aeromicrobium sp. CnD17-E]
MTEPTPAPTQAGTPVGAEEPAPYGGGTSPAPAPAAGPASGPTTDPAIRRVRTHHLQQWKEQGHKWVMLTTYDQYTAATFDEAGVPVLFIGDSAANNVFGYASSLPVTVDELLPLVKAVTRTARRALVVADLPFGSYQRSPEQAYDTAVRFMKEGEAHVVKLEGGAEMAPQIELLTKGAVPVMAHIGFTPQSEHALGGYRVQGRGDAASRLMEDALAVQEAGASSVVMEMVPAPIAAEITERLHIPTIGIGAGPSCDAQVLVWQDMLGLRTGKAPRFVKRYADLHGIILGAAQEFAADVASGTFPAPEHSFDA